MTNTTQAAGSGIGFGSVLFFIFLVLKLTGVIDWSWWWVTAPLWGGFALAFGLTLGLAAIFAIVMTLGACIVALWDWARN